MVKLTFLTILFSLSALGSEAAKNCESINSSRENSKKEIVQDSSGDRSRSVTRK